MRIKYETFYTCPKCGCLVPKETYTCDCGYVFRKQRNWGKIMTYISACVISVSILTVLTFTAYKCGQASMSNELKLQYNSGQSAGDSAGRKVGYDAGYAAGKREFNGSGYNEGYHQALLDADITSSPEKPNLLKK